MKHNLKTYWIKSMTYINRSYSDFIKQACVLQDIYNLDEMPRDCSTRQYTRIIEQRSDKTYVLMDSSLEIDSCVSFSKVGRFLIENQFKVPKIYYECHNSGLMLLEDFGNLTVSQALERDNSIESLIYINATNNLIQLAKSACSLDLPHCDSNILNKELQVFLDWTLKFIIPEEGKFKSASNDFLGIFTSLYKIIEDMPRIMMLRDYHADNLMLLPTQKQAECQIGILDFQDALLGSHCYDLVSLLEDARRDVSPEVVNVTKEHYFDHFKDEVPKEKLEAAYTILGAQRNLKIIGIFRRLYMQYGKGHRLSSLPRVTRYIFDSLNSPQLFELKNWFEEYITQGKDQDSHIFLRDCV